FRDDTGGGIPPMGLNPCGDPFGGGCGGGGSGDGGYEYPEPPQESPCEKIKTQNNNTEFKGKIDALNKQSILNQKKETGFSENKNGNFTPLPASSTNSSDALTITITPSTKGYIHTHQNDYETGNTDDNGNPEIRQPIRMFSPADVNTLMTIASFIDDGNYEDIYGAMISSYGNYTIKFTGTASDIQMGFNTKKWRDDYKTFIDEEKGTLESKFLRFLKEKMNVQGIELYKIKSNGTIQKKTLNANNQVQSNDCP
ncbi:hypothetical protein SOM20_20140, partial [Chryseobacterium sp. CFBP8996]|nr:hypothetical protein [Chryseobacterium sp. CFBP8996]